MMPNGWSTYKFSEIVKETQLGTTERHKGELCSDPIPLLKMGNLSWGGFKLKSLETLPRTKVDETLILQKGDFLFNTRNTPELVGKSAVWNGELTEAVFDNNINRIVFHNSIDPFYLGSYLNNGRGKSVINSLPAGSTSVAAIYWKDLKNIKLILPPLPEQRKIAKILSTWGKAITTTEKLIETSKQQKKALMQQLLIGKKRLVSPETGKAFEGEWEEVKLGELGQTFTGLTGKTKEDFGSGSLYIPYINIFNNSSVNMAKLEKVHIGYGEKQNTVQFGDVFFTTSSETPDEVGMSSVMLSESEESVYLNSFCFGFRPNDTVRVVPEFMQYLLRSNRVRRSISVLAQGATRYNLSKVQLLKISLFLPTYEEQQKIASALTAADRDIEVLEAKLSHLKQEKKALMQQLLTGKRRVQVEESVAA